MLFSPMTWSIHLDLQSTCTLITGHVRSTREGNVFTSSIISISRMISKEKTTEEGREMKAVRDTGKRSSFLQIYLLIFFHSRRLVTKWPRRDSDNWPNSQRSLFSAFCDALKRNGGSTRIVAVANLQDIWQLMQSPSIEYEAGSKIAWIGLSNKATINGPVGYMSYWKSC